MTESPFSSLVNTTAMLKGRRIVVGNRGEVATIRSVHRVDRYNYHDAPDWGYVITEEYAMPFHFNDWEQVMVVIENDGLNPPYNWFDEPTGTKLLKPKDER